MCSSSRPRFRYPRSAASVTNARIDPGVLGNQPIVHAADGAAQAVPAEGPAKTAAARHLHADEMKLTGGGGPARDKSDDGAIRADADAAVSEVLACSGRARA